jgi:hypothetical protein
LLGLTSFLIIRMWFGKSVQDFNNAVQLQTTSAPSLISELSNGFTSPSSRLYDLGLVLTFSSAYVVVWVGYAFHAVPLVCALAKLHVTAAPPVGKA